MWSPLHTLTDSCFEYLANLLDEDTRIVSDTLRIASERDYCSSTSGSSFYGGGPDLHQHWNMVRDITTGIIQRSVSQFGRDDFSIYHIAPEAITPGDPLRGGRSTLRNMGAEFIDLMMIRMPHDTKLIESRIADALARKEEYNRKQDRTRRSSQED